MFALDLFNTDHERRLTEGAVDQLEQRRIDDLAMRMDDLVARAKQATTAEVKQALMKEFQKCKAERDSYYMVRNETMGYGTLTGEGQVTPTATGIRHHARPENYGGYQPEPELKGLNKTLTKNLEKGMGVEFKKGGVGNRVQPDMDEGGIPGNVPVEKIPGKEDLLKGKGRSYYEADQKKNSEAVHEARLAVGDPITVTAPNEFEGKTGEIYEFSPSGSFVIVDLYNHGKHSMHLSDVEYNKYADDQEQDDWYDEEMEEGYASTIGINPKPLDAVSQWKFNVRQLIADYIDNPQGLYNIAKQKGANSAEAMAYKFIMHPKGKIDLPPDAVTFEGYQDFNKVEPYAVCLAGKPVKKFDYYEEARRFHDNWKQKLYREGNKEKADKITLMPLNLDEEEQKPAGWGEFPPKQEITIVPPKKLKSGETYQDKNKYWQSQGQAPIYKTNESEGSWIVYDLETKQIKKRFKTHTAGKSYAKTHGLGFASSEYYFDRVKDNKEVAETALNSRDPKGDYAAKRKALQDLGMNKDIDQQAVLQRRLDLDREAKSKGITEGAMKNLHAELAEKYRELAPKIERNRDSFKAGELYDALEAIADAHGAGEEFTRMMRGARNRAHMDYDTNPGGFQNWFWYLPFEEEELSEEQDTSGVERAILNRIMVAHTDLLMKFGPDKVMQAAEEVAYNVGDVDEIGTSDVSAYVDQVKQILGVPEEVNEKWSQKYKSSINCANPKGFSQRAHCAGKKKK
jgi:hypothetical protein